MPAIDDLDVIRELLAGKPPSQDVNDYAKGRLTAVIAAAESHPGAGRRVRRDPRSRGTVAAGIARNCRRRLVLRSVAGAAAALAAAAVALAAAGVPGARHNRPEGPAVHAASVVKRIDRALSATGTGDMAQMTVTTRGAAVPGGTTTAEEWSYRGRWRVVTNSSAGHPVYDEGSTAASVYTLVSYPKRAWARQPGPGRPAGLAPGPRTCEPVFALVPVSSPPGIPLPAGLRTPTVATALRAAISCGTLGVAGRQRVDGIEAIELTSGADSGISETIWVNPDTYRPLRVVVRPAAGQPGPWQTADITWLPPTTRSLAKLTVPIPAGFRQVPLTQLVRRPYLREIPTGPLPKSR